ncbi:hypothetical protein ABES80_20250 [Bacillus gobiensis]|uniref:YqgU-like beta propeller domain-containing protein n=1 Tax=Bacillus gobiensis TaxID=1441095 RepID=UPI003D196C04
MRLLLLALAATVLLAACNAAPRQVLPSGGGETDPGKTEHQEKNQKPNNGPIQEKNIRSIADQSAEKVFGWLDEETIVFSAHNMLKSHNLFTGKETTIFKTSGQISDVQINQAKKRLLIQSAAENASMELNLVTNEGDLLFKHQFDGYEFQSAWNPFQPDLIFLTAFKQDWTYTTFLIHAGQNKIERQSLQIPFAKWSSEDTLEYLKWNNKAPETSAPLYRYHLSSGKKEKIYDDIVAFAVFSDVRLAVKKPSAGDKGEFMFSEADSGFPLSQYSQPLAPNYSSWDPGEYDYDSKTKSFYLFNQKQLKKINVESGEVQIVLSDIPMEPINLSPDGMYALYGYSFEQVISILDKKIVKIMKEGDE